MDAHKEFVTVRDVTDVYNVPESTQRLLRQGDEFIPHYKVGRRIMYRRDDLEAWFSARAKDARDCADSTSFSSLTAHQIARLRDVSADAGLTSEQIDRLMDALTHEPEQSAPEPAAGGAR